jgi:hypothetical protein
MNPQNTFPILKHIPRWFPGAGFKRQAEEWLKLSRGMLELPFAETKRQMVRYLPLRQIQSMLQQTSGFRDRSTLLHR